MTGRGKVALTLLLLACPALAGEKHELVLRAYPPVQIVNIATGCSKVWITAELKGPEVEEWYCPKITWIKPDGTKSVHQQDCPPFAERNECYPKQGPECIQGWHRDPNGIIIENAECPCTVVGYPKRWIHIPICAPEHPAGDAWEVVVFLESNSKMLRQTVRFLVK